MQKIDDSIVLWAQTIHLPVLDVIAKILAVVGYFWFIIPLAYFIIKKRWKDAVTVAVSVAIGFVGGMFILKDIIGRPRPFVALDFTPLVIPTGYSFPSGHTLVSFAGCSSIWYIMRKQNAVAAWGAVVFAAVIGLSRLYLGVHYPSDIIAGVVLGVLSSVAAFAIVKAINKKRGTKAKK